MLKQAIAFSCSRTEMIGRERDWRKGASEEQEEVTQEKMMMV